MDMRDTRAPQLEQPPEVVVSHGPAAPAPAAPSVPSAVSPSGPTDKLPTVLTTELPDVAPPRRPGLRRALVATLAVLALVVAGWLLLRGGDDSQVATEPGTGAPEPAAVAPLSLTVDVPTDAVAGRPAGLVVHYADGAGVFGGSTEEWGDDVGTSSLAEDICPAPAAAAAPVQGSYTATHTWAKPGSYPVKVAVSSYTCVDGAAVLEEATTTVTVEVAAK
jgi:hypothetical protein